MKKDTEYVTEVFLPGGHSIRFRSLKKEISKRKEKKNVRKKEK